MTKPPLSEPFERLADARREAGFATASEAARAFGWNENTYRSHENGERGLKLGVAQAYAKAFKTTVGYLMLGFKDEKWGNYASIAGYIESEGVVRLRDYDFDLEGRIARLPIQIENIVIAYEVSETAGLLIYQPGDLILVWGPPWDNSRPVTGFAIVDIPNADRALRMIRPGERRSTFHLELPTIPTIANAQPRNICLVCAVIPRNQWTKLDVPAAKPATS